VAQPIRVTRHALRPLDDVWDALVDPRTYPTWLVGCKEIRAVDDGWPREGLRFHHRVGLLHMVTVNDHSELLELERPRHFALDVRFRPFGRGRVDFWLAEEPGRDGAVRTRIDMDEKLEGPLEPATPLAAPLIDARNRSSLNAFVAMLNDPHPNPT
jgi:uncharacterized protein YndB with AHSA1/START domain